MSLELVLVCSVVGIGTYLFRYLPTRWRSGARPAGAFGGPLGAFLGSVGISAVTALLVASSAGLVGPAFSGASEGGVDVARLLTLLAGLGATAGSFVWKRSVALSTMAGAVAYGLAWWLLV